MRVTLTSPALDVTPAGDNAVGGRLLVLERRLRVVGAAVDTDLVEGSGVDQQVEPLAGGQLAALVLGLDLGQATAEFRLGAALVELVGEFVERGGSGELVHSFFGHQRPFHSGSRFSKKALTPSIASSVESSIASWARR